MNKDLINKELQIKENEVLEEDLFKLPAEQEAAFNAEWVAKINEYRQSKRPKIWLKIDNRNTYTGGTRTVLTYLVNAAVLPSTGTIVLNVQEESGRMHTVHLDDCFKEPTTVSPKQKLRKDDARTYMSIVKISNGFTALLNELAAAKEKLYIDYKIYKRSAEGKAHSKMADLSVDTKELVKNWFLNNINRIEFSVPTGDLADAPIENEFDQKLVDEIKERFLDEQGKIIKWFNLDISPDLYNNGKETIAKNVDLTWRWANGNEENNLRNYNIWAVNTDIYFKTPIADAPEEVKEVIKSAKARSTQGIYKETARFVSSNILGIEIINELFGGDINFLANVVHGSEKADEPGAHDLLPKGPVKTREPEHDLDLDFDDIDAYGDIVQ